MSTTTLNTQAPSAYQRRVDGADRNRSARASLDFLAHHDAIGVRREPHECDKHQHF